MKKLLFIPVGLALIAALIALSVFQVSEGEIAIVTRFGDPVRIVREAGPHRKRPGFLEKVNRLDRRIQVFKPRPIQLMLKDQDPLIVTCYVSWRISDPLLFFQSLGTPELAELKLGDMVNARLGSVLGDYGLSQLINTDPELVRLIEVEAEVLEATNRQAREQYGLEIVDLGLRRVTYPAIVTQSVYDRMKSDREKEAQRYRAEGAEEAAKIEAEADRRVSEILAESGRKAEIAKGEGDREAIRIRGEAYSQDPELFEFLDSLDTYRRILGRETTLILSLDSDLFRYLFPKPQEAGD
ncbi:MAG: protease modulator HflC [Candidatus Erginobacter occultus]|nr:protease modulator HflC [Candidatus Erginobacter occultus]